MRVVIAGSRNCGLIAKNTWDYDGLVAKIDQVVQENGLEITEVVSGNANGPDKAGERWAKENGVPLRVMKTNWKLGRGAAFINNAAMADASDALIVIYDGSSKGTAHMIDAMKKQSKAVYNDEEAYQNV